MKQLDAFVRSSVFAAMLAVAGVTAGAVASVYASEIKFFGWETWVFLVTCVAFFALVGVREWRVSSKTENYQQDLIETVRTMPPKNLLNIYSMLYIELANHVQEEVLSIADSEPDKLPKIETAIRYVLDGLASLVAAFENYPEGAVYSANIMLYKDVESLRARPSGGKDVLERLKFVDVQTFDGLKGVLDLELSLSCISSKEDSAEPNDLLSPLALPVPEEVSRVRGKPRYLPGAPTAFFANEGSCLLDDSSAVADIVAAECDVSPAVVEDVRNYFGPGASMGLGSILSVRVDRKDPTQGIINIQCDKPNILNAEKQLYTYVNLISPLTDLIYRLLAKRRELIVKVVS